VSPNGETQLPVRRDGWTKDKYRNRIQFLPGNFSEKAPIPGAAVQGSYSTMKENMKYIKSILIILFALYASSQSSDFRNDKEKKDYILNQIVSYREKLDSISCHIDFKDTVALAMQFGCSDSNYMKLDIKYGISKSDSILLDSIYRIGILNNFRKQFNCPDAQENISFIAYVHYLKSKQNGCKYTRTTIEKRVKRMRKDIMMVVMKNIQNIKYTYFNELARNKKLHGRVDTKFRIDEDGNVVKIAIIKSTTQDSILDNKLIGIIHNWKFGKINSPKDTTEIIYPFIFEPK
jgi:TonB family protein